MKEKLVTMNNVLMWCIFAVTNIILFLESLSYYIQFVRINDLTAFMLIFSAVVAFSVYSIVATIMNYIILMVFSLVFALISK